MHKKVLYLIDKVIGLTEENRIKLREVVPRLSEEKLQPLHKMLLDMANKEHEILKDKIEDDPSLVGKISRFFSEQKDKMLKELKIIDEQNQKNILGNIDNELKDL